MSHAIHLTTCDHPDDFKHLVVVDHMLTEEMVELRCLLCDDPN